MLAAVWSVARGVGSGELSLIPCPVHALTDIPCPGCGITRASVAFVRGEWGQVWELHPFAFLLVPLALLFLLVPDRMRAGWGALSAVTRSLLAFSLLGLCLALWMVRSL